MAAMSDSDIVKDFLVESYENLDRLDRELVGLEKNPRDQDALASVFRTIHTIKGTCGFLGFGKLEEVAHVGESLLTRLRDGQLSLNAEITTALLAMVDAVRQMLKEIDATGADGELEYPELRGALTRLQVPAAASAAPAPPAPVSSGPVNAPATFAKVPEPNPAAGLQEAPPVGVATPPVPEARPRDAAPETIRVGVNLLDNLMTLVGELVLARNQLLQYSANSEDAILHAVSQRMNLIATELQEEVMKTRMQPIGNIWAQFPRTVRDVALNCGKQVRIEMEGKETELDKTIIEAIKAPLTHLVRNSVDHGIELPADRVKAGKDPTGRLTLRAFHEGGQVNIEISDDGAGLDTERIRKKAVERGVITLEQAARMPEREIFNLIFLPGFSTAQKVTNVSGRGVGMDVVKTNVEKIGGAVDLQSHAGRGTTVRVKIPLTLAIIPALVVTSAGDRYAIPRVSLLELVRLEGDEARTGIEQVRGAPVHRLRGKLLPLVYLNHELKVGQSALPGDAHNKSAATAGDLNFAEVREKHRQWVATLLQVLDGKRKMTAQEAGSYQTCALGKWIYATGLTEFGAMKDMQMLEKTHKQFHELVQKVLLLKHNGGEGLARQELESVRRVSDQIVALTRKVEGRVLESGNVNIVVLQAENRQFGLVVDEINDTEEIVVKPLGKQLKGVNTFAGATIMGDGKIALILDALGLAQRANVIGEGHDHALAEAEKERFAAGNYANNSPENGTKTTAVHPAAQRQALLLFETGANRRMAIPLSLVARLEEFAPGAVEHSGRQPVVRYRGQIMPLIRVSEVVEPPAGQVAQTASVDRDGDSGAKLQVVVYAEAGRSVGLVVERILDIVEQELVLEQPAERAGILGSAVVQQRVTDLLDVEGVVRTANPRFFAKAAAGSTG
jgi:chemotaxis protein histidine kinase CheA